MRISIALFPTKVNVTISHKMVTKIIPYLMCEFLPSLFSHNCIESTGWSGYNHPLVLVEYAA